MKRSDFLRGAGLIGLGSILPVEKVQADTLQDAAKKACTLIPTETAGPFPLDLTENSNYFRTDIRETKTGVPLHLTLKILGASNCLPMQNVRVNIWHCDKDGLYSGYSQTNNQGQAGLTYLRGYQFADANGEVAFTTIFPGWYSGRICHIHFQVYVSSSYAAISQLTFDIPTKNTIYTNNASLYTKGMDPMTLASDNIFSDGYAYQLASLTANPTTGGYDATLEITVQGSGTTGLGNLEKQNAQQFSLGQNYPNPFSDSTTIPVKLQYKGSVKIELWDLSGKKVATLHRDTLTPGEHLINIDLNELSIPKASYVYQIEVTNANGTFKDCKMMTAQ